MRSVLIVAVLMMLMASNLEAQDTIRAPKKPADRNILERIDFGGYLGIQFGTITLIDISPLASYHFTERLYGGLGLTYTYYKDNRYEPSISMSSYGGSIFGGYYIWRDLFAHVEYAPLYIPDYYDYYAPSMPGMENEAPWAHDIYIGGGYRQWVGERASVNMMLLFNINETVYSPYSNPIIRIGFGIGL
jgi:hypothetical protein